MAYLQVCKSSTLRFIEGTVNTILVVPEIWTTTAQEESQSQGPGDMLAVRVQVKHNSFFCENSDKAHVLVFILETSA